MSTTPQPSSPGPLPNPAALNRMQKKTIDKVNDLLAKNGCSPVNGQVETAVALAAGMKSANPDFAALAASLGALIPVLVAWAASGGGLTVGFGAVIGLVIVVAAGSLIYKDLGAGSAYSAILEHRIASPALPTSQPSPALPTSQPSPALPTSQPSPASQTPPTSP